VATPEGPISITASAGGVSMVPDEETTADGLIALADGAMYSAKDAGRDRTHMA